MRSDWGWSARTKGGSSNIRKNFINERLAKHYNRLLWEVRESPTLELSNIQIWHLESWFSGGPGSAGLMDLIVRVLSMFLTRWGEGENLANLSTGSSWVSGMGWMIKCLERAGQDLIILWLCCLCC